MPREAGAIACAWRLARVTIALARYRGERLQGLLTPTPGRDDAAARDEAARVVARMAAATRYVRSARCLSRAIAAVEILRARDIAARLNIGVRRVADRPRAHAWLSVRDHAIGEDAATLAAFEPLRAMDADLNFD